MKDGRTHLAHKAEHAVDLNTGAIVAVTLQGADEGDTTTIVETAVAAAEQVEDAQAGVAAPQPLEEIFADKGYHSNQTLVDLDAVHIRTYIAEPDRGRRDWSATPEAQAPVYANRRRIRGPRGRRLMCRRGELIERSFAHIYDTGGMRRTHLRGHTNILKRLLIHVGAFNLGLVMRHLTGVGTPRDLRASSTYRSSARPAYFTDQTLCQLVNDGDLHHGLLGMIIYHLVCSEIDAALDWYEHAIEQRQPLAAVWASDGFFRPLRSSPRWPKLARMMSLPETG